MILTTRFLVLLICLNCPAISAIEIEFEKDKPHNSREFEKRLEHEADPSFSLLDSLTSDLNSRGYLDAEIVIKNGKITIFCGQRYTLSKIVYLDNEKLEIPIDQPFDSIFIALEINRQLQIYRDSGYHYASCQPKDVTLEDNSVFLTVSLNKGPLVKKGELIFAGLTRTNKELVRKYVPETNDGILTAGYLQDVEKAAAELSFVKFSPPVTVQPRPGYTTSDLFINFLEKTPVRFDGAAGLTGKNDNAVVWSLGLSFNNLFGQGKQFDIASDRLDQNRKSLNVGYSQPLFVVGLGELGLDVSTRDYREEFYEFSLAASYQTRVNRDFVTGLKLSWKSSKPETKGSGYNSYSGQFSISRKTFADGFNPRQGLALKWEIAYAYREYTASAAAITNRTFNESRTQIKVTYLQPFAGPFLSFLELNYAGLETKEALPPLSELVLIGGPASLRGYRDEQFAAIRAAFGTLEPRIRFDHGYIFAFYDAAYLNNRIPNQNGEAVNDEQFRWGYGFGLGLGDGRRNLILSLGLNPDFGLNEPRLSIELSSDI